MSASDFLKNYREKGYSGQMSDRPEEDKKNGMDSREENSTSRIIKLTDDEQKKFAQANPGDNLACEVHGTIEKDGHFHVMSVDPMNGADSYGGEGEMAGQVAQKVMPNIVPSPS